MTKPSAKAVLPRGRRVPWRQPVSAPIDKAGWGPGPWEEEPDVFRYSMGGVPCLMVRQSPDGNWCGYIWVSEGHPWSTGAYTRNLNERYPHLPYRGCITGPADSADCHGGITYQSRREPRGPRYRHTRGLWVGFDCSHTWDLQPGAEVGLFGRERDQRYRDAEEVGAGVDQLALQAIEAARVVA